VKVLPMKQIASSLILSEMLNRAASDLGIENNVFLHAEPVELREIVMESLE
jgi:hypothetical protein